MTPHLPRWTGRTVRLLLTTLVAGLGLWATQVSAEPALWKVVNGPSTAYLFGSVHLLKPTAVWDTPKVEAALGESRELWLEITDVDDPAAMQSTVRSLGTDPAHPLTNRLDPARQKRLAAILSGFGAPPTALDALRPWLAAVTLSLFPMQKAGYDPAAGVDRLLKAAAVKRGLPVMGFETSEGQLHYLSDMSEAEQMDMLHQTIDDYDTALAELDQLEAAWERGDDGEIARLEAKGMTPALYQRLLAGRNVLFARRLVERMKQPGVIFVAVGAAHLAGPDSVQALLARSGLKAVRQ
jgi:uncharacterized protein YbaP (TraB family)